jgi:DNA gyrase subunit A
VIDLNTKEEDFVNIFVTASTHSDLLFFSDRGKVYQVKMYDVPEGKRATKGKSIMNFLSVAEGERITSVLPVAKNTNKASVVMVTKNGVVKKVDAGSFADVRKSGIIAIKLGKDDKLLSAMTVEKGDDVILATRNGQSIRFSEADARQMGRSAAGVKGIKLTKKDSIVGASVVMSGNKGGTFLVVTAKGYGKKTNLKEYKTQKRSGSGIKTSKISEKTGPIVGAMVLCDEEGDILAISKQGQIIRISLDEVPVLGRQTQGVRIMKVKSGDSIASITCL